MEALFRMTGLLACDNPTLLDAVVEGIRSGVLVPAEFRRYFERQLLPLYQENVAVGPRFNKWTNNACELENHVLKQAGHWRSQQLSELIECIRRQYTYADQSIYRLGNFAFTKTMLDTESLQITD